MEQPRPESKESAARQRPHAASSQIDVIVLTTDSALLATLREAAGSSHDLFSVESPEAAVDLLVGGHCGVFIIDVALVRRNFAELIEKLQSQFPEVVLLATGQRNEQSTVVPLVGNGRIYRFLHKPVSPARAKLFLSAASRRYGDLHTHDSRPSLTARSLASPRNFKFLGCAAATLIVVVGVVWLWPGPQTGAKSKQVAAPSTPQPNQQLANLLARADAAYDAGNVVPPSPGNALELYQATLQIDANNQAATLAVERIVTAVETQVNDALAARDMQSARNALTTLQRIAPTHPRLATLQTALTTAPRTTVAQSRAATVPPAANASTQAAVRSVAPANAPVRVTPHINPNINLAKAYLAANQLLEPPDASALGLLRRARDSGESDGAVQITATDLGSRLLNNALAAVAAGNANSARTSYAAAVSIDREFETSLPDLDRVDERIRDLDHATQQAKISALLERATRLRLGGHLVEPAGDNAVEALRAAVAEDPSSAVVKTEQQRLTSALLDHTRTALVAGDIDRADVMAGRAEELSPGLSQTRALRERIGIARTQREEATNVVQAANLPRRHEIAAVYPRDALRHAVEGWVDLEFTISEEGVPNDIKVKAAQPARVFDLAASQALRQWRFEPIIRDGAPRARRAVLRMEFKLKG